MAGCRGRSRAGAAAGLALVCSLLMGAGSAGAQLGTESAAPAGRESLGITVGLAGLALPGQPRPVVIDIAAGPEGSRREVVLQQGGLQFAIPIRAEAGGRRRLHVRVPPVAWGETWRDDEGTVLEPACELLSGTGEVALELTRKAASVLQGVGRFEAVAALPPGEAPRHAEDWAVSRLVLLDAAASEALDEGQWRALRDHVLTGATLVVHGAELGAVPAELLATASFRAGVVEAGSSGLPVAWLRPGRSQRSPDLPLLEDPGLVVTARLGLGSLVTIGFDLAQSLDVGLVQRAELEKGGLLSAAPRLAGLSHAAAGRLGRSVGTRELSVCIGLVASLLLLAVLLRLDGRFGSGGDRARDRSPWLRGRSVAVALGLSLLAFGLGAWLNAEPPVQSELVVEEYFGDSPRRRVTRYRELSPAERRVELSPGPGSVVASTVFVSTFMQGGLARGRVELSSPPVLENLRARPFHVAWWRTVSWEDVAEPPLRLVAAGDGSSEPIGPAASLPGLAIRLGQREPRDAILRPPPRPNDDIPFFLQAPDERRVLVELLLSAPADVALATDSLGQGGPRRFVIVHRPKAVVELDR